MFDKIMKENYMSYIRFICSHHSKMLYPGTLYVLCLDYKTYMF